MKDYYNTLGVSRTASDDEIKRSYRRLASQHHPDKGGDTAKFQEIEEAYRVLSDPVQRQQHDSPNINFGNFGAGIDPNDIFRMFTQRNMHRAPQQRLNLWIRLEDVALGGQRLVAIPGRGSDGNVQIEIPLGINDGDAVRYPGMLAGNQDLIVQFRVQPDAFWQRDQLDLVCTYTADFWQLILGATGNIATLTGQQLEFNIPERTRPDTTLRLKSRGLRTADGRTGDILVKLKAVLPVDIPEDLVTHIKNTVNK